MRAWDLSEAHPRGSRPIRGGCAVVSWGGQRPGLVPYVTGTGPTDGATAGDGFLTTFDGPARAVRCAAVVSEAVRSLGVQIRAALHSGECEVIGENLGGIAVHIGARVTALAAPDEVLVSSTVKDLVAGSGLRFQDRGVHGLRGVPGEWRLFAIERLER